MCAIAGVLNFNGNLEHSLVHEMCGQMELRGPDNQGFFFNDKVGLGHCRLSIIDLETGDQPMYSKDGSLVIVFNGEIYNYLNLRDILREKGYEFVTQTDTEVILNGYKAFGINGILERLEGMFAFALYDLRTKDIYIARDKFGEKPLFYIDDKETFKFASELKAFKPDLKKFHIDNIALNYFFTLTYIPSPYTIYREIRKLEAGMYIHVNSRGERKYTRYYHLLDGVKQANPSLSFQEAKLKIKDLLTEAVRGRMVSDVPMGAFLSGGIDSSIVCCLMDKLSDKPINTFSIGFKEKNYDESERARVIAKHIKSNHTEYILDYKDVLDILDDIITYYDEPFGDSSAIPSFYVAKLAREKVKVVLTGDCADEIFGGYEKYLGHYYIEKYKSLPSFCRKGFEWLVNVIPYNSRTSSLLSKLKKVTSNAGLSDFDVYYNLISLGFHDDEREKLLKSAFCQEVRNEIEQKYSTYLEYPVLSREQRVDIHYVLEGDMFSKIDRACMHNSLENRAPFIDSSLVNFVLPLPSLYKIKGKNKKYILKEAFKDLLPGETLQYSKKGFGVPVDSWFKNELKDELAALLDRKLIDRQGLFDFDEVQRLFQDHLSGKANNKGKLWNLFVFQKWYMKQF